MKFFASQLVALLLLAMPSLADAPVAVKGSHIVMQQPEGLEVADRFPGFMSQETGASVMVTELPAPYVETTKGFNSAGFKTQGMTLISEEAIRFGALDGKLYSASQSAQGVEFMKWLGIFGDASTTYIVTAAFPKAHAQLSEPLKSAVLSARVSAATVDPMAAVTFRVSPAGTMKLAKVIGNMLLFTKDGIFPARGVENALFVAAPSLGQAAAIPDKKLFAEARLTQVKALREIKAKETTPLQAGGLSGFESLAEALDADTGAKAVLYQAILYDGNGYYLMQGIAGADAQAEQVPVFKQMARSFVKADAK